MADVVIFNLKRRRPSIDDLIDELEEAPQLAVRTEQPGPAVAAVMGKGRLLGLGITTRVQMEKVGQSFAHMNVHQIIQQIKVELGDLTAKQLQNYVRLEHSKREDQQ
jgi:hypothetical protein